MNDAAAPESTDPIQVGTEWVFPDGTRLPVVRGGDGPDDGAPAPIERPEDLTVLTVAQLTARHTAARTRRDELQAIPMADRTFAQTRELRDVTLLANDVAGVINEVHAAPEALTEVQPPAAPPAPPAAPPAPAASDTPPETPEVPETPPAGDEVPDAEAQARAAAAAAGLTAAAVAGAPATPSPDGQANEPTRAVFTAAVGNGVAEVGAELDWQGMVAPIDGLVRQTRALAEHGGRIHPNDREVRVASVTLRDDAGSDLTLGRNHSTDGNTRIILAAQAAHAAEPAAASDEAPVRTAAVCGPADIIRAIPECIGRMRPIRAMFTQIPSDHAQFQFIPSIGLAAVESGVTVWTDADQAAVDEADPDTWKPCVALACTNPVTVAPQRVPSCLTVEVMQSLSTPEQVDNWVSTIGAQTERVAEGLLLGRVDILASAYTVALGTYGSLVALFDALSIMLGLAEDLTRELDSRYVLVLPNGLIRRLRLDSFAREFTVEAELERMVRDLGLAGLVVTPDYPITAAGVAADSPWADLLPLNDPGDVAIELPAAPTTWTVRLVDPSAAFFFSPDEFAFGMSRDPQLMRQNKMQWFGELFENIGKNGCAPWFTAEIELCPNGARAAGVEPVSCAEEEPPGLARDLRGGGTITGPAIEEVARKVAEQSTIQNALHEAAQAELARIDAAKTEAIAEFEAASADALQSLTEAVAARDPQGIKDAVAQAEAIPAPDAGKAPKGK